MSKALATKNIAAVFLGIVLLLSMFAFATPAHANPSFFANGTSTSAASSSPRYMTTGNATGTIYFDAYGQTFNGGQTYKADSAILLTQFSASNTSSTLGITAEYADATDGFNCANTPAACDWYRDFANDPNATTTAALGNPYSVSIKFASSTLNGASSTNSLRSTYAIPFRALTRYMRLVFTMSGANGAVWAKLLPIQQRQ